MKKKSWSDVQMAITAISITATLGMWSMFSGPERAKALAKAQEEADANVPPAPTDVVDASEPTQLVVEVVPTTVGFTPLKIIYGGTPPAPKPVTYVGGSTTTTTTNNAAPAKKPKKNGGGGGSGTTTKTS